MTLDLDNMTQAEFDKRMAEIKEECPNLFQFIVDFINKKVSIQEVEAFQKMEHEVRQLYIKKLQSEDIT